MKDEVLAYLHDAIDDRIVWGVVQEDLDDLIDDVAKLIP